MVQQRLYTEEQVKKAMILAATTGTSYDGVLKHLAPIELPSDEEIENEFDTHNEKYYIFSEGAKWMRDQILNK